MSQRPQVLIVEDHKINQFICVKVVESLNLRAVVAENGADALEALKGAHFDLILMDCQMPVLDGYEATREIRRNESTRSIPIIGLTASSSQKDRILCLDLGMNDYLPKPFEISELTALIKKFIR